MSKSVRAQYWAAEKILKLESGLEGIADQARIKVTIESDDLPSWTRLIGSLSPDAADAWKKALGRDEV